MMEKPEIKPDRYYSDGQQVRRVLGMTAGLISFHPCEFFKEVPEGKMPEVVQLTDFQEWAKFEVMPNWAKVVR